MQHIHNVLLLENDLRFRVFGDQFSYYDYRYPLDFNFASVAAKDLWNSRNAMGKADLIIVDPPFLSEECFQKTAETVIHFSHDQTKIILNTGLVMNTLALQLLSAKVCTFRPKHSSGLANEFRCYTNFQSEKLVWELESPDPQKARKVY